MREVGLRLAAARHALELSQAAVCKAINVQPNTYSQWEGGHRLADPTAMARFADIYGISMDWVYRGQLSTLPTKLVEKVRVEYDRIVAERQIKHSRRKPRAAS